MAIALKMFPLYPLFPSFLGKKYEKIEKRLFDKNGLKTRS